MSASDLASLIIHGLLITAMSAGVAISVVITVKLAVEIWKDGA